MNRANKYQLITQTCVRKKYYFNLCSNPTLETWIIWNYDLKKESISDPLVIVKIQYTYSLFYIFIYNIYI